MNTKQIFIAFKALTRKEIMRCLRIWPQTLLPPAISMSLYFLIFGRLIGSQLHTIQGFTYMQYIVPGLVMMSVITNSYTNAVSSFFGAKFQRSIEELLVSPTPNYVILLGYVTGTLVRALMTGAIVMGVSLFFTHLIVHHVFLMLGMIVLTAIFFGTAGVINGIYARTFDDISWVVTFFLTPLTYLGGVFFTIDMLSGFWQKVAYLDPILYLVDLFRYSLLGVQDTNIFLALFIFCAMTGVLFCVALYLLKNSSRLRS
jgi:ABC-2 type transport system permease protein